MLVLTRGEGEEIVIQPSPRLIDDIRQALGHAPPELSFKAEMALDVLEKPVVVTCVLIRGDKVRLGTEANAMIDVHRLEVYDDIQREGSRHERPGLLFDNLIAVTRAILDRRADDPMAHIDDDLLKMAERALEGTNP